MSCSDSYKLECESFSTYKKFELLHNTSLILKIFALLCIIPVIWKPWFLAISAALFIAGSFLSQYAFKQVFTYEYLIDAGILQVNRHYRNNASETLAEIPLESAFQCVMITRENVDFTDKNCYIDPKCNAELYLEIIDRDNKFYIIADKYFYSLLMENK
ncbi:MAG TPA: hypothetical protein PKY53_01250 [Clostridia bacterium]|jgi:hypothetical protein|nr:hypothetical protein [Clostridia bacterium]